MLNKNYRCSILPFALLLTACATKPPISEDEIGGSASAFIVFTLPTPIGLAYRTGYVPISGAEAQAGSAAEPLSKQKRAEIATSVEDAIASLTAKVWPEEAVPVVVSLGEDRDPKRSLSRWRIKRRGTPWQLWFPMKTPQDSGQDVLNHYSNAISHELYHLMAANGTIAFEQALPPNSRKILEETSAFLYGACASIVSGHAADLSRYPQFQLTVIGQGEISAPFPAVWRDRLADALIAGETPSGGELPYSLHIGINRTIFDTLADGAERIQPGTRESERLLSACRDTAPDPGRVLNWLSSSASETG